MKGKKYKRSQHSVQNIYEKYFGIRKPYQIIVDAPFCIETLKIKIAPSAALTEVFGGAVKLMTTPCIQAELSAYDRQNDSGASFVARRFEIRRCQHDKGSKSGSECIKDLISTDNPHHYCIAGQDLELRKSLRKIAGVPLIFILRDTVLMEAPAEKSLEMAKKMEGKKLKNVDLEIIKKVTEKIISSVTSVVADETEYGLNEKKSMEKLKKPKKKKKTFIKSPNPLSCKKASKKTTEKIKSSTSADSSSNTVAINKSKKPRKRRPKKKKLEQE
jgi:U3 small nucleolar RNA-associated protein 23